MRVARSVTVAVVAVALGLGSGALAQKKKGTNVDKKAKKKPGQRTGLDPVGMAHALAAWARENKHPAAMAVAAQVLSSTTTKPLKGVKKKGKATKKRAGAFNTAALRAEAKKMCGKDKKRRAAVETVLAMGVRAKGRLGGSVVHVDVVAGRSADIYTIPFRGDEPAAVGVRGRGIVDLDLHVYDENGNLICKDDDSTDRCVCEWRPLWTGPFRIKVTNLGDFAATYLLVVQ